MNLSSKKTIIAFVSVIILGVIIVGGYFLIKNNEDSAKNDTKENNETNKNDKKVKQKEDDKKSKGQAINVDDSKKKQTENDETKKMGIEESNVQKANKESKIETQEETNKNESDTNGFKHLPFAENEDSDKIIVKKSDDDEDKEIAKLTYNEKILAVSIFKAYRKILNNSIKYAKTKYGFEHTQKGNTYILSCNVHQNVFEITKKFMSDNQICSESDYNSIKNTQFEVNIKKFITMLDESYVVIQKLMNRQAQQPEDSIILNSNEKTAIHNILNLLGIEKKHLYRTYGAVETKNKNKQAIALSPQVEPYKGTFLREKLNILKNRILIFANKNNHNLMEVDVEELYMKFRNDKTYNDIFKHTQNSDALANFIKAYYMTSEEAEKVDEQFEDAEFNQIIMHSNSNENNVNEIIKYLIQNKLPNPINNKSYIKKMFGLNRIEESSEEEKILLKYDTIEAYVATALLLEQTFEYDQSAIDEYFEGFDVSKPLTNDIDYSFSSLRYEQPNNFKLRASTNDKPRHLCKNEDCLICGVEIERCILPNGKEGWKIKETQQN